MVAASAGPAGEAQSCQGATLVISEADLQSTFLTALLLFVAGAQVVHAQAPTRTGSSTFSFTVDTAGCPTSTIVNTRFLFAGFDSAGLVLRERTAVTKCYSAEGVDSRILVEAWPATAPLKATPRFVINAFGIGGDLIDYRWYRVHQLGCCGPSDDWVYYSAITGRELFTSSLAPPIFFTLSGTNRRWIAVHDSYSAFASAEMDRDSTTAAVIQIGDGVDPSRRIVVRGTKRYSFHVDSLAFRTTFPRRDPGPNLLDPIPDEGVSIILVLSSPVGSSPDRMRIELPIVRGGPSLERATLPSGFTIRWGDTRP